MRSHVFVCVYGFMTVCIKPLAHECLRMCLFSCVGVHLSVVATVYLYCLNQFHLKVKYFLCLFIYLFMLLLDVTYNVEVQPEANCG